MWDEFSKCLLETRVLFVSGLKYISYTNFFQSFFVLMTILALVNYKQTNENLVFRSSAMLQASLKFRPSKKSHFLTCFDLKPKLLLLVLMLLASFGAFA